jgi:FkbM family methyltransferase
MSIAAKGALLLGNFVKPEQVERLRSVWHRLQLLSWRALVNKRRFRRLNRRLPPGVMALRHGLRIEVDPRARESFEWFCFRSSEMVAELDTFLAWSREAKHFLDVGACHGLFSLAFIGSRPQGAVMAIEPSPVAFDILASNVSRNGGAVAAVRAAVGAGEGSLRMRSSWHHLEACASDDQDTGIVVVPATTLDNLCAERGFRPDLAKIDVEGYELQVLQGAQRLLSEQRPTLFLEVHPVRLVALGASLAEVFDLLTELGYRVRTLDGAPLGRRQFERSDSTCRVLCTPAPPPSRPRLD